MQDSIREMLERGCRRTCRAILEVKDSVDESLSEDDSEILRSAILDHVNQFHKYVVDVIESSSSEIGVNAIYLDKLEDIHKAVLELQYEYDE